MAIAPSQLPFGPVNGSAVYTSGALHNVFGPGVVNGTTDYALIEVRNTSALTWTSPKMWLQLDTGGAAVAIAVGDATARDLSFNYGVDPTGLSYSTPTSFATGLALPTLPASFKALIGIRRTLTGASPDYPDGNTLFVRGSSPI